jgi:hypothetical protein
MGHAMKKLDHRHYAWLCAATLLLLLAGCQTTTVQEGEKPLKKDVSIAGYHLGSLPRQDNVHKLFIPRATVLVREPHLQTEFINILISEFTKEQTFEVVPREEEADHHRHQDGLDSVRGQQAGPMGGRHADGVARVCACRCRAGGQPHR